MKVIIAGGRDVKEPFHHVGMAIAESPFDDMEEVVSGGARGVDAAGEKWAALALVPVKRFPADWDAHGKAAGPIRNKQMADYADCLIAVWDGKSRGTKHMIDTMTKLKKPVYVYNPNN